MSSEKWQGRHAAKVHKSVYLFGFSRPMMIQPGGTSVLASNLQDLSALEICYAALKMDIANKLIYIYMCVYYGNIDNEKNRGRRGVLEQKGKSTTASLPTSDWKGIQHQKKQRKSVSNRVDWCRLSARRGTLKNRRRAGAISARYIACHLL